MKKLALLILLGFSARTISAQTDMAAALQSIGENVVYTEYWDVTPVAGGKNTIGGKRYVATLKPIKNRFGKIVGFDALEKETGAKKITYNYMYNIFDNYTHPAYMSAAANHAYAIINGVIFYFEHFENTNSFEIDAVWVPTIPKDRAADAVFQGGKMSDLKSADLMKMVKDYFAGMKKIQDANPYNEVAQSEADAMKFTVDSTRLTYDNANAAYWNSPEGQKKLNQLRKPRVTLYNDTQGEVLMCYGQGVSTVLKPGEKKEFSCDNGKIFKGKHRENSEQLDSTGDVLLNLDGTNCGVTINASTLK